MTTNCKTAMAMVPPAESRAVKVDRTVVGDPTTDLTNVVGELMGTFKDSLLNMDDITAEVALHSDSARRSVHVKLRAYRHRDA
jgi:hypothetical protein